MGRLVQGCILAAAVVCSTFPTEAQTGDGSLRDYVRDAQGGVLPGVTVTAHSTALLTPVYVERRFVSSLEVQTTAARDRDIAVYIQDNWKRHPRLTINAGVRADFVRRFDDITPAAEDDAARELHDPVECRRQATHRKAGAAQRSELGWR